MFYKTAAATAELTTLSNWRREIVGASVKQDPVTAKALSEFDLDRDNFIYVRARAVSCYELHSHNRNGDAFEASELEKSYRTFLRRGVYINHNSDDPEGAIGIILDAVWHPKQGFVQTLMAIDKNEPIADKISKGLANHWSMGALVEHCKCSVCDKVAYTEKDYCECLANYMGREYQGKKVFAFNKNVNFYELSNVTVPADPDAHSLEVLASKKGNKMKKLITLAKKYENIVNSSAIKEEPESDSLIDSVRQKLSKAAQNPTSKQLLGQARRKLRFANAPSPPPSQEREAVKEAATVSPAEQKTAHEKKTTASEKPTVVEANVPNEFTITYVPGKTLEDCWFIARKGNLQTSVSASSLLDDDTKKAIVAAESKQGKKDTKGAQPAEKLKDKTKPNPDNTHKLGDEPNQPHAKTDKLSDNKAEEMKDDSKPNPDNKHEVGKDPAQPSDMVKRYAELIGAKRVAFTKKPSGSFVAQLTGGSISRLATLWKSRTQRKAEAKVAGEPGGWAREHREGEGGKMREKPNISRESGLPDLAKPSGSSGGEVKRYFQGYDSRNLADGGGEQWARKVAALEKKASELVEENKKLKAEADVAKKTLEAFKKSVAEHQKGQVIGRIVEKMERTGAFNPPDEKVLDLMDKGLDREAAQHKAYQDAVEEKRAELSQLNVKSLETLEKNFDGFVSTATQRKTASFEIPEVSRSETPERSPEDILADNWE